MSFFIAKQSTWKINVCVYVHWSYQMFPCPVKDYTVLLWNLNFILFYFLISNPSWSWEKCDPDQWLHHRRMLPDQHLWSRAREHGRVRFKLHQARAEWKATGQFLSTSVSPVELHKTWDGVGFLFLYPLASDSAARLPHEDSSQLPPPEEDCERKWNACKKLTYIWIQRREISWNLKHHDKPEAHIFLHMHFY